MKPHEMPPLPARAREILREAQRLFYADGYPTTGINQIIAESKASKKSFYKYYPSKDDLARAYLLAEARDFLSYFRRLAARRQNYRDFVEVWCRMLLKQATRGHYHGCPFGNFASQTAGAAETYRPILSQVMETWRDILMTYLGHCRPAFLEAEIPMTARRIMFLYQGAVQVWKISGDPAHLEHLREELLALAPRPV